MMIMMMTMMTTMTTPTLTTPTPSPKTNSTTNQIPTNTTETTQSIDFTFYEILHLFVFYRFFLILITSWLKIISLNKLIFVSLGKYRV